MERNRNIQFFVRKTKKDLLEVVESYAIGKIRLGFRSFNLASEKGSRVQDKIDFYMEVSEFELLCHNLLSGNIVARLKSGEKIPPIYKGSPRDGKIYSRVLAVSQSNRGLFITATEGPGKKNETGAVQPLYKFTEAPCKISISLDIDEVKSLALQGRRACDVYYQRLAIESMQSQAESFSGIVMEKSLVPEEPVYESFEPHYDIEPHYDNAEGW